MSHQTHAAARERMVECVFWNRESPRRVSGARSTSSFSFSLKFNSKELFKKVPLLGSSPHAFGAKLASSLVPSVHFKDDVVVREDASADAM